jgi:hypothetical protein
MLLAKIRARVGRGTFDRNDNTTQLITPVFLRFGARKKAQLFTVISDPEGFSAFSEFGRVVDSEVGLAIYSHVIPI